MKLVIQRVNRAEVKINDQVRGAIKKGYLILVGAQDSDGQDEVDHLAHKVAHLRIFEDENGKMNLNIKQVSGSILSVSQFTLLADTKKGNRPTFTGAGDPDHAKKIYESFNDALKKAGLKVETGVFGADMDVDLENHGPSTFILNYQKKENN